MNRNLIRAVLFSLLVFIVFPVQADDARHPHHIGVAFGGAGHGSETSGYLSLDYSYRFKNNLALFLFAEDAELSSATSADTEITINDFYSPFVLSEITPENMQSWPYYRYASMNWDEYGLYGTVPIKASKSPVALSVADAPFDLFQDFRDGRSFVESLHTTQTKGFLILKDDAILGEFYDNGFSVDQTQLL